MRAYYDGNGDFFEGQGELLTVLLNLPSSPQDITCTFSLDEVDALNLDLLHGGNFAIAFDPDCHFYNNGISLELGYSMNSIPEPATLAFVGTGLVGLIGIIRRGRTR